MNTLSLKKITSVWVITLLVLFVLSIVFGILMRFHQANQFEISPVDFYILLTTHGVTMIGIWAVAGMVGVNYLLSRYVKVSTTLSVFAYVLSVIGILLLWFSTFIGKFHSAWTFLYPLPFYDEVKSWSTPLFFISIAILGVAWLVWAIGMILEILKKYTLRQSFAWQHFSKSYEVETPPMILIATVSLIGIILCLLSAVVLLILLFVEYLSNSDFVNDPLLMKNLTYLFGHTLANEALYLGLAAVYELMPEVSNRPKLKTTWYVALGWNCTLFFVMTAFFHHLYMDPVQPLVFQMLGQFASYFSSVPATVVTVFSIIAFVYKNPIKWSLVNTLFFIGIAGWIIGIVGAVIDATISKNVILHNTLWVPAHFHTYNVMGNVLFSMAFFYWFGNEIAGVSKTKQLNLKIILLLIGGFGFVLMFYLGGADSVPRRFSVYPKEFTYAALYASIGAWFAIVYLIIILLFFWDIVRKCGKIFSSAS